jgi:hypothetical protein
MADGLLGAYFGNPNIQRQGARARALAKQRDVNLLADPKTYAVVQGLLGTPPDQLGFSVLNPKYQEIKQVAEPAFYAGSLLQVAPATAPAVNRIAQAVGPRLEQTLLPAFEAAYNRGGLTREMVEAMGNQTVSPLTVFHGSPAKFNRFDRTKIGSGEGAQAYGYGHYIAESPDVARRYQMGLTQAKGEEVLYKNKPLTDLYSQIENKSMKLSGKAADVENQKLQLVEHMMLDKPPQELIPYAKETGFDQSVIDWLEKDVAKNTQIPGAFYEIDLPDEQIARMIDLDKKLSEQPEIARKSLLDNEIVQEYIQSQNAKREALNLSNPERLTHPVLGKIASKPIDESTITAQTAYDAIARQLGPEKAAELLRQSGVPGMRYFDEGSRGTKAGTSNFVVFPGNEDMLTILKRNGGLLD